MEEKKVKETKTPTQKTKEIIAENEKLKEENKVLNEQMSDFKDKWMRNVAEFDNYKKRNARIWQDAFNEGASSVILKILTVGDTLDYALSMNLDEKTLEGLKNIKKRFDDTLKSLEVEEINPVGEPFDPNVAEAVMQAEKEEGEESDTVKFVLQKGYKLKDKIIRYAKVSVIK